MSYSKSIEVFKLKAAAAGGAAGPQARARRAEAKRSSATRADSLPQQKVSQTAKACRQDGWPPHFNDLKKNLR